uniref:EF-hand domain-containing protein n=1 Tax=Alexandrium catenella TaxID=2925 RepID=A0A7S1M1Z0_ALECA
MLKGITCALRTVFVTGMLLVAILYLFGIVFKIQSKAYPGLSAFPTVGESMWVLLLNGAFLDAVADIVLELVDISWILTFIFMVFIFLSNLTILNMLVGILCEVATQVDKREKEQAAISYLKHHLIEILEVHDKNDDRHINKDDFELLMRNPEMHMILKSFGVDTEDLLSLQGILFESKGAAMNPHSTGNLEETNGLTPSNGGAKLCESKSSVYPTEQKRLRFAEFLEVVLRLRGGNFASVRDIVDLREYLRQRMDHLEMQLPTKVPHRPVTSESTLRISASAGFDASSPPSFFCETVRPDDAVGKLLDQIEEVREELRSMRAQVKRLEDAKRAPEVEETQVTAVTPRTHSATSAAPTVGDH